MYRRGSCILVTMGLFMIRIRIRALRVIHFVRANLDIPTSFAGLASPVGHAVT
jgi:hypothetical protein